MWLRECGPPDTNPRLPSGCYCGSDGGSLKGIPLQNRLVGSHVSFEIRDTGGEDFINFSISLPFHSTRFTSRKSGYLIRFSGRLIDFFLFPVLYFSGGSLLSVGRSTVYRGAKSSF